MKSLLKHRSPSMILIALLAMLLPLAIFSQTEGSGNVQKQNRPLPPFNKIEVGSAFTLYLSQGEPSVIIETDDNLNQNIETLVEDGVLQINSNGIKNPTSLKVYVTAPDITDISLSGAARLNTKSAVNYPVLHLEATGASRANIEINAQELTTEVTGASRVTLRGSATNHVAEVTGASSLNALMLKTITTTTSVSGAGKMSVFAKNQINADVTGAGIVSYFDNPQIKKLRQTGSSVITLNNPDDAMPTQSDDMLGNDIEIKVFEDGDSTFVKLGDLDVNVKELDDMTKIELGKHELEIDDDGNVKFKKNKKEKFDGHWGGVDLGINGLINADNKMDPPVGYEYLDLRMEKSINVAVNLYEQNFNLVGEKLGLTTGLGIEWNNFRFNKSNTILDLNADTLTGFIDTDEEINYSKSKLVNTYLTLPLMFEFQTNNKSKGNSLHFGVGVLSGLRIGTHTKVMYNDGDKQNDKERGAAVFNPFKLDAMARIGWGKLNIYGKYALLSLVKDGRGPELYPFSVGISLLNW
ncbi:MAG: GIN domain-containing protein [Chloroflexota bacterium]